MKPRGGKSKVLKVLGVVAGALALIVVALQLVLNSPIVTNTVTRLAEENLDGTLRFSRVHFSLTKSFPALRVTIDTLSLTYPHERFASFDEPAVPSRLLSAGRGEAEDTLARFDRFTAAVNPWRIIFGEIRLRDARLRGLGVYAHAYDSTANWNIFRSSPSEPEDTTASEGIALPWISIGEIELASRPRIVYTAQEDTLYAELAFDRMSFSGDYKIDTRTGSLDLRHAGFSIDSLSLEAALPKDSLSLDIPSLCLESPGKRELDLSLRARAFALTGSYGKFDVPLSLDTRLKYDEDDKFKSIDVPYLTANVAYIPLTLSGYALVCDSTFVKADVSVPECDLGKIWTEYGRNLYPGASDIKAKGHLTVEAAAKGYLTSTVLPEITLGIKLPDAYGFYRPAGLGGYLNLDLDAAMDAAKCLNAKLSRLDLTAPGLDLGLKADVSDLLGRDPAFSVDAEGEICADSLSSFLPENMEALGDLAFSLRTATTLKALEALDFDHNKLYGTLRSGRLELKMPDDTLSARVSGTKVDLSADDSGINIDFGLDSLTLRKGAGVRARVRGMENNASLRMVESRGRSVPRLSASTHNRSMSFKSGTNRIFARGVDIDLAIQKRVKRDRGSHRHRRTSYRDSLSTDFKESDISVSLDSSAVRFLDEWNPSFSIGTKRAAIMTPELPLRTRVSALSCRYENNILTLDSLGVTCGTSDVFATGEVRGLRRFLSGKKGMIRADLEVDSKRINANELLAALEKAKTLNVADSEAEQDESFVVDSIAGVRADSEAVKLIALPGNVIANIGLEVARAEYSDIVARPLRAYLRLQDRTLQILDANLSSNVGNIGADAFYATRSKDGIYAGFNLKLSDVSAYDIIHLVPTVDKMMPALKSFEGRLGCELSATTQLDTNMNVVIPTLDGLFKLSGENLTVRDLGAFRKVARLLMFKDTKSGHIDNLNVSGVIHDSRLELFPFELGIDRYKLALEGTQNYDKTMKYHVSVMHSPLLIPFGINMRGSLDKWRLSLGLAKYRTGHVPTYTAQLDTMQINIVRSIRQIFRGGAVDELRQSNAAAVRSSRSSADNSDVLDISSPEYQQIDSLFLSITEQELERSLEEETSAVLAEAFREATDMNSKIKAGVISNAEKRKQREEAALRRKNERH